MKKALLILTAVLETAAVAKAPPAPRFRPVSLGERVARQAASRGCASDRVAPPSRVAVLWSFYGPGNEKAVTASTDRLGRTLQKNGYRVIRADNFSEKELRHRLTQDRDRFPADYRGATPLLVLQGRAEYRGERHFFVATHLVSDYPRIGKDDSVHPDYPRRGAVYRLERRRATEALVGAFVDGIGDTARGAVLLAAEGEPAREGATGRRNRERIASLVAGPNAGDALKRFLDALENPIGFDRNGDGRLTLEEIFPRSAGRPVRWVPESERRPSPSPVPGVAVEGTAILVGRRCEI